MAVSKTIPTHSYEPINEKERLLLIMGQYLLEEESTAEQLLLSHTLILLLQNKF